jgi:release factor glutamine methyltransferase
VGSSDDGTVTWRELWADTARVVGDRAPARWLCEVASGLDADELLASLDEPATERMVAHLDAMLARLREGEPLQYVLGRWGFRRLDLFVDRRVLIPRPETEQLVEIALDLARAIAPRRRLADLGTGSGAIGLALADELPLTGTEVWLTDVSADALDVARANLAGLGRAAANVRLAEGSWFAALPAELAGTIHVIVSNPPYVGDDDPDLEATVRRWEPAGALFGGPDGLHHVRAIVGDASRWLVPGGWLAMEIGSRQGAAAAEVVAAAGLVEVAVLADLAGLDRIVLGRRSA